LKRVAAQEQDPASGSAAHDLGDPLILWRHQNGAKWRYEKTARSFMGLLALAAACDWLKS